MSLIDLDSSVYLSDEEVCGIETYGSCEQPKGEYHQCSVPEVEKGWNEVSYF